MRKGYGEYPPGWPEFAEQLKQAAGWQCIRCGHPHDPANGYCLTVHHATMNKAEPFENWWAFLVLCQRCHLTIQSKVILERPYMFEHSPWFRVYVAGYYAARHGHPTEKAWVMENLEMLLDYGRPCYA